MAGFEPPRNMRGRTNVYSLGIGSGIALKLIH